MEASGTNCILPDGSYCNLCCYLIIDDKLTDGTPLKNTLFNPCTNLENGACARYEERSHTCRNFDCQKASPALLKTLLTISHLYSLPCDNLPLQPSQKVDMYFRGNQ